MVRFLPVSLHLLGPGSDMSVVFEEQSHFSLSF